jgi:hypothetical protein
MAGRKATGSGDVAKLAALLPSQGPARGRGRHSSLYRWLQANRKDFAAMLATMQPAWRDVATGLAALGLRDGDGKPPTGERARKAWWDVQRGMTARKRGKATPAPPPLAPCEIAPAVRAVPPEDTPPVRPRLSLDIRPATPLGDSAPDRIPLAVPPPAVPVAASHDGQPGNVQAQLRRIEQQMQAGKVPLTRVVR